jgi:death-on-curing protein
VLDQGLLESAVAMPAAGFGDRLLHEGAPAIAGAYLYHICRGRPFLDGNKRSALAAAGTFLLANDIRVKATQKELVQITLGVAEGRVSKDEVVAFFRDHCRSPRSL